MRQFISSLQPLTLLCVAALWGCTSSSTGPVRISVQESEVLLDLPGDIVTDMTASPDGTIFVTTSRAIFEARPPDDTFRQIAETPHPLTSISAPSPDTIYGVEGRSPVLYLWSRDEGLYRIPSPLNDSVRVVEHGVPRGFWLFSVWAPSSRLAYAAGLDGVVLRAVDGVAQLESNPMIAMVDPDTYPRAPIYGITGRGERVYAVGRIDLMERTENGWVLMDRPPEFAGPRERLPCGFFSAAVFADRLVVGGGERSCLYTRTDRGWSDPQTFGGYIGNLQGGRLQSNGMALFYAGSSIIAVAPSGQVAHYEITDFEMIRGVVATASHLYIAGRIDDRAVILRTRTPGLRSN